MIAVVGCGLWGMNIIRTLSEMGKLTAICDSDFSLAQNVAQKFNVLNLRLDEVLSAQTVKGVVLSIPVPMHAEIARSVLNAGKHVWIEKPMTLNLKEAQDLYALSQAKNLQILVGHVIRYHGAFQKLCSIVHAGDIGNILYIECVRNSWGRICPWEKDALWSLGVHDISLVLALMPTPPVHVLRYLHSSVQGGDQGMILLKFDGGVHARISSSWCYPIKEQRCVVMGSKGSIVFDDTAPDGKELELFSHHLLEHPPFLSDKKSCTLEYDYSMSPLMNECYAFMHTISTGEPALTHCKEALLGIEMLTSAQEVIL